MEAWIATNDDRLSLHYQPVTVADPLGQLPIYAPEQAAQVLPELSQEPEAKARFERVLAIQTAMERLEEKQEAFVEEHGVPRPPRPN